MAGTRWYGRIGAFGGSLANKVGTVLTPATGTDRRAVLWSVLSPMADRGMILLPAPFADEGAATTRPRATSASGSPRWSAG